MKVLGWVFLSLALLLLLLLLFIRSPFGQDLIVNRLISYVSGKTKTEVSVDRLFVTFRGNLYLEELYLEDMEGDTLLYSGQLETGIALLPFLRTGEIRVSRLEWQGLEANVHRDSTGRFNFGFLLDAFSTPASDQDSSTVEGTPGGGGFPELALGPVLLNDWDVRYSDELLGLSLDLKLGRLELLTEKLDLNRMDFHIGKIQWENTAVDYVQEKPLPPVEENETESGPLPLLVLDELSLNHIDLHYISHPDDLDVRASLGSFGLQLPEADLQNQRVQIKSLLLQDTELDYQYGAQLLRDSPEKSDPASETIVWPDWEVTVGSIDWLNNNIKYGLKGKHAAQDQFDPEALGISELSLQLNQVFLNAEGAGASLDQLSFRERSGFNLETFQVDMAVDPLAASLKDMDLKTGHSQVQGQLVLSYAALAELLNTPDQSHLELSLDRIDIGLRDAFYFSPELRKDPYIRTLARKQINTRIYARGDLEQININEMSARWGPDTRIGMTGSIRYPLDTDQISWELDTLNFISARKDVNRFVREDSLGLRYPESVSLALKSSGNLDSFDIQSSAQGYGADLMLQGRVTSAGQGFVYDLEVSLSKAPLGEILGLPDFGSLGFELEASGNTGPPELLELDLQTRLTKFEWKGHDYQDLTLQAVFSDGRGNVNLRHQDELLDFELTADTELTPETVLADLNLDLKGADFYRLNISPDNLRGSMEFTAHWEGNATAFSMDAHIDNGTVVLEEQAYPLGTWDMGLKVMPDTTDFSIESNILKGQLQANADPGAVMDGIVRHFNQHLETPRDSGATGTQEDSLNRVAVNLNMNIVPGLLLDQVLLPELESMDSGSVVLHFDERRAVLEGSVDFPYLSYAGIVVDSLGLRVNSNAEDFDFAFGLLGLESGPLALGATYFTGKVLEKQLYLDFNALDGEDVLAHVAFDLGLAADSLKLHVNPDSLIFNKKTWTVPESNEMWFSDSSLVFRDFSFTRESQNLSFYNEPEGNTVGLNFENFRLATFTSLLNPDETLASGMVNGEFILENPFGATGFLAGITVTDLNVLQVPLGNLALDASSGAEQRDYDFDLSLSERGIDLEFTGDYQADTAGALLNLSLDLNKLEMAVIEGLSQGAVSGAEGFLSGSFSVNGNINSPQYQGRLKFNNTAFNPTALNAVFKLNNEEITLDNQGVYLDQLTIFDADGNEFSLDGRVLTENLTNPGFDLDLSAENFRFLNSTAEDNDLFYGDAIIGAEVSIGGDLNLPEVSADLTVENGTNLTFVVPETQLDVVEREGVVNYVNRQNPDDILTKSLEETSNTGFSGYQVSALLQVSPEAKFNVVIDPRSGDNLMVEGAADLRLDLDPNGRINLTGIYELSAGHYELSLYSLVNRRFEIRGGSTITWAGDPLDASMDITAIYNIKTSAVDLMTATAAGGSRENMMQYRQQLPFIVYLNIQGEMLRPLISFTLDMPEDEKGALGGSVYAQVQQLNSQEGELNRQVFSLLVLNRFFPSGANTGGGGATAMAKSSVSQLLSSELNSFTENALGGTGFELDVDLDSFQDYQGESPQSRTQLNLNARKRFLDDRLIVQVGSQIDIEGSSRERGAENALLGNVSIEYLLTENGRYRIRGFRKNQFESFIDGQLVVTGFSAIFNREFNHFDELWRGIETRRNEKDPLEDSIQKTDENQEK
ncbi:Family of unknown function [Cyclobacterium lianum]|uniref:Translocation and assembly module TamB C-terminal domain-containing protein n=1 Tax=Cyclobacterium lianum TaxID=388280 RepID=A0A1M7P9Q2_9BACT|nr:translocation/assembly module TamB domain-containing protein [Cyclobacterium lianum]SHN13499.1 Family of unknown function [Cyclobacterium lianum]